MEGTPPQALNPEQALRPTTAMRPDSLRWLLFTAAFVPQLPPAPTARLQFSGGYNILTICLTAYYIIHCSQ